MKYAIVTGGTSGIGLGVVKMLIKEGYHVFATYVGKDFDNSIGGGLEAIKTDQADRKEVYKFISYVKERTDHIDCIVCNAGMSIRKSFTDATDEDWDKMMEVAVNSHYILIREFFHMIPCGSRIIFTASHLGIIPHATVLAYGVTKAAIIAMARNLVKEFEGSDTTVNSIAPGFVDTPWQKNKPEDIKQNIYKKTAIHRFAHIEEIVEAYRFCIKNSFINGSVITIDGGYSFK